MRFKQNWTILFQDFQNDIDGMSLNVFARYAAHSRFVYDIGMNAGLYVYLASAVRSPGAKVFGFEPNTELATLVRTNLAKNSVEGIEIVNCAISDHSGLDTFFITNTDHMHSLSQEFLSQNGRPVLSSITVPLVSLDNFVRERSLDADLIKIDVEGLEVDVLSGAKAIIVAQKPTIILEITRTNLGSSVIDSLFDLRYSCFYILPTGLTAVNEPSQLAERRRSGQENYLFTIRPDIVNDLIMERI